MFQKNEQIEIEIIDIGENGEGIGKIDGFTIFVSSAIPGDIVNIKIIKLKKQYAIGKVIDFIKESSFRVKPECLFSDQCGGCQIQDIDYNEQLVIKKNIVKSSLERIGGFKNIVVNDVIGMKNPREYRNKSQYPIRFDNNEIKIGFYKQRTHDVVDIDTCMVQEDSVNEIMNCLRELLNDYKMSIYDERSHKGFLRHIVIRISYKTKDTMVIFVTNGENEFYLNQLKEISLKLSKKYIQIKSFIQNINSSIGNVVMGRINNTILGEDKIIDFIKEFKFEISPSSFLQVNPIQTEILYDEVLNVLDNNNKDIVFDIFCGIGTISLFLSKYAKKVYGVEVVDVAIEDAKKNAINNNIDNTEFIAGKAEIIIPKLYKAEIKADIVVLDPPRKGCDEVLLQTLLDMEPKSIVYVSCKASTLARDLKILSQKYEIETVQPVDMFPHTTHVETIVKLSLKK